MSEWLEHGGQLRRAARHYGIAEARWLDLSTGIAPYTLALPELPASAWQRLPEADDGLEAAARDYYGCAQLLAVAGSQAALQVLPQLRAAGLVGVLSPSYAEHARAWRTAGHRVRGLSVQGMERQLAQCDVLLLVNPNNPTGQRLEPQRLLDWHAQLAERGGWLVVDEAFIDCAPAFSLASACPRPGLIVLRSFGKFFGLAGARLGFVLGEAALLERLAQRLGPWAVSGPARAMGRALLADYPGQARQRQRLLEDGQRLARLLADCALPAWGEEVPFRLVPHAEAAALHAYLAERAILTRLFSELPALRLGLPGDEAGWQRLAQALHDWKGIPLWRC